MSPLTQSAPPAIRALPERSTVLRALSSRDDRVPRDQRVDLPEIQEPYRISFSNAAKAAASGPLRDAAQRPTATDEGTADVDAPDPRLRAYRSVAAL